jgi:hypothetical protein
VTIFYPIESNQVKKREKIAYEILVDAGKQKPLQAFT